MVCSLCRCPEREEMAAAGSETRHCENGEREWSRQGSLHTTNTLLTLAMVAGDFLGDDKCE